MLAPRRTLIKRPVVEHKTGFSKTGIYERVAKAKKEAEARRQAEAEGRPPPPTVEPPFPIPVVTGPQSVAWVEEEIDGWIDWHVARRDEQLNGKAHKMRSAPRDRGASARNDDGKLLHPSSTPTEPQKQSLLAERRAARGRLDEGTRLIVWALDLLAVMKDFHVARLLDHAELRYEVAAFKRAVDAHKRGQRP